MNNKQLEINVNSERLLARLSNNLNIDFISDSSNIKKMALAYSEENSSIANAVDQTIANGFLLTMEDSLLESFGNQYGIYRKKFNNIKVLDSENVILLSVDLQEVFISDIANPITVFTKGSVIYSDDNILIESTKDIIISSITDPIYIGAKISGNIGVNSYSILEGTVLTTVSSVPEYRSLIPQFNLTFKRSIGLALIEESIEDYRLRLYEATYIASNGANSLVSSLTKEIPMLKYIETDDYKEGRAIKKLFPYTEALIRDGSDELIGSLIVPLLESNLAVKSLYGSLVDFIEPKPLLVNISININDPVTLPTQSYLNNILLNFNLYFATIKKSINKDILVEYINKYLLEYNYTLDNFSIEFTSPYISEETFDLNSNITIDIPLGRFLHLSTLTINQTTPDNIGT